MLSYTLYSQNDPNKLNLAQEETKGDDSSVSPGKKKKKKPKKERTDELEPLRLEAFRLSKVPAASKPYYYKPEG